MQRLVITYIRTKLKLLAVFSKRKAALYALELFFTPQPSAIKESALFSNAAKVAFTSGNYTIRGYRFNKGSEKKVMILHGFSSNAVNFEKYVTPLVDKGFEVLALDAPAHGISSGKRVNAVSYKNMVEDAIATFGPVQNFITHSFGGLAVSLAMEEINPGIDTKLVLIAPAADTPRAITNAFELLGIKNQKLREEFDRLIKDISGHGPEWYSVNRALLNSNASVLIVQDEDDFVTPLEDLGPLQKSGKPDIRFHITKGLGHNKIYRDGNVVQYIVNFIAG